MPKIDILLSADDNHAPYAAAVIRSVVKSATTGEEIAANILTLGFTQETKRNFSKLASDLGITLRIIPVDAGRVASLPDKSRTKTAYLRIFAGELIPDLKRVIYLDTDILVRSSLSELWHSNGEAGAAVLDPAFYTNWSSLSKEVPDSFDRSKYFNSGVLVMNLDYFRRTSAGSKISKIRQENESSVLHDQSALNVFLEGKVEIKSESYNYMPHVYDPIVIERKQHFENFIDFFDSPKIVHFSNYRKPWLRNFPQRFANEYREHLKNTPWGYSAFPKMTFRKHIARFVRSIEFTHRYFSYILKQRGLNK